MSICDAVSARTHREVRDSGVTDILEIAKLQSNNFQAFKKERIEQRYLAPYGLNMDTFVADHLNLNSDFSSAMMALIQNEYLNTQCIITGMDDKHPNAHIYSVGGTDYGGENFQESSHFLNGFCAIGSGSRQFESVLMSARYDRMWNIPDTLLLIYCAKRKAQISPGVGGLTDIWIVDAAAKNGLLDPPSKIALEEYCQESEAVVMATRSTQVLRMRLDRRLFEQPVATPIGDVPNG